VGEASYATISPSLISDSYPAVKRNNALTIFYVAIPSARHWATFWGIHRFALGLAACLYLGRGAGLILALALLPFAELKRGQAEGGPPKQAGWLPPATS